METALKAVADAVGGLAYVAGLVALVAAASSLLTRLITRRGTVHWVWNNWNLLGAGLVVGGLALIGYGWLGLGIQSGAGSALVGLGLLLGAAGLWMVSF